METDPNSMLEDLEGIIPVGKQQGDLNPRTLALAGVKLERLFRPVCGSIGGDIFDIFQVGEQHLGFYQLDVVGHELRSSILAFTLYLHMANTPLHGRGLLRKTERGYEPTPPEEVLRELNNLFQVHDYDSDIMMYFTMIYGYFHKQSGELKFASAGHPCPIYLSQGNAQKLYVKGGVPLGMFPGEEYESVSLKLQHGDRLFLYSDGVTECTNGEGTFFSEVRLVQTLEKTIQIPLAKALHNLEKELRIWHGDEPFNDDISILAIERI